MKAYAILLSLILGFVMAGGDKTEVKAAEGVVKDNSQNKCDDVCFTECENTGSESCFSHCNCPEPPSPTNEDLFSQNQCYATCSMDCASIGTLDERLTCIQNCPCQCNTICQNHCRSTGLITTCNSICGCPKPEPPQESASTESEQATADDQEQKGEQSQTEEPTEEKAVDQSNSQDKSHNEENKENHHGDHEKNHHKDHEENHHGDHEKNHHGDHDDEHEYDHDDEHDDDHKEEHSEEKEDHAYEEHNILAGAAKEIQNAASNSATMKSVDEIENKIITDLIDTFKSGKVTDLKEIAQVEHISSEIDSKDTSFSSLVQEMLDDSDKCQGKCWRQCLTLGVDTKILKCAQGCGCAEDSYQLLEVKNHIAKMPPKDHSGSYKALFLFMLLAGFACALLWYVDSKYNTTEMKRKRENEDQELGEAGYERLD